jgi:hypothetical protein
MNSNGIRITLTTSMDLLSISKKMFAHPNFTYIQRKPTWEDIVAENTKPDICNLTLNSRTLNRKEGFEVHRVVLIGVTDSEVIFHDPNKDGSGAYRHEAIDHFRNRPKHYRKPLLSEI